MHRLILRRQPGQALAETGTSEITAGDIIAVVNGWAAVSAGLGRAGRPGYHRPV
jgi:hypothetical protein